MASDAVEAARANKAARDARANASVALRGTTASSILNRANEREGGTGTDRVVIGGPISTATNANAREGRTGSGGIAPANTPVTTTTTTTINLGISDGSTDGAGNSGGVGLDPVPKPRVTSIDSSAYGAVKTPNKDILNISSLIPQESAKKIERLIFEQMSAIELSMVLKHDTIDGINQDYAVISNLSEIRKRYNATKSLSISDKNFPLTSIYEIDINSKIPGEQYLIDNGLNSTYKYLDENNVETTVEKGFIYIDTNGDLIIEFENMSDGEQVEIQIDSNGTIYKVKKQ